LADEDVPVQIAEESAIIVWDQAKHRQHFIRRASFDTSARDIGFLVPTPSTPALAEAEDASFQELEKLLIPKVVHRVRNSYDFTPLVLLPFRALSGADSDETAASNATAGTAADEDVEVVHQQRVSGYDAVVLTAPDTKSLNKWLTRHDYASSPALMQWLAPYIARGWKITAFKIARREARSGYVQSAAVRMSFNTDKPLFPYREPQRVAPKNGYTPRLLRVFLIAPWRADGRLENGKVKAPWPKTVPWANALLYDDLQWLKQGAPQFTSLLQPGTVLTILEDRSSPRLQSGDLYFSPSAVQQPVVPPPIIRYDDRTRYVPADLLLLLFGLPVWLLVRRTRQRVSPSAASCR
jgi:hypothetical protein